MDKNEFITLVSSMREMQRKYFKTKDANVLIESKRLEKEVDKALEEYENQKLGNLF